MDFIDFLLEFNQPSSWTMQDATFDFEKSYIGRTKNRQNMEWFFDYKYSGTLKSGREFKNTVPVWLSNNWHVQVRQDERSELDDDELKECIRKAMIQINKQHRFEPNGYLIKFSSLGIVIPLNIFKNADMGNPITRFAEVKTVLRADMIGTQNFAISSDPNKKIRYILPNAHKIILENLIKTEYIVIEIF